MRRVGQAHGASQDRECVECAKGEDEIAPGWQAFRGIDGPIRPIGKGRVEPVGDGERSRFTFEIDFEEKGFGKLLVPLVRRQARRAGRPLAVLVRTR